MRWLIRAAAILLAGAFVYDVTRAPAQQVSARLAVAGIQRYQRTLSPLARRAGAACRFTPTCSHYAETVIARNGVLRGGWLALRRIVRCGPWTPAGTKDPP